LTIASVRFTPLSRGVVVTCFLGSLGIRIALCGYSSVSRRSMASEDSLRTGGFGETALTDDIDACNAVGGVIFRKRPSGAGHGEIDGIIGFLDLCKVLGLRVFVSKGIIEAPEELLEVAEQEGGWS
jgi:hypothetical protein